MGYLPQLYDIETARDMISTFGGYNHNLRIADHEFYDMRNMTSDYYPVLSPRHKRTKLYHFTTPNGLWVHDKLCWVDGTSFYYDGVNKGTVANSPKQFVNMGAFVLIFPDKKYYNTKTDEFGSLGCSVTTSTTATITMCKRDGEAYSNTPVVQSTAPTSPTDGMLWVDTASERHVLKQYSAATGIWTSIATTYVKISATGIGTGFSEYDGVSISGCANTALNGEFVLMGASADYIIITALIYEATTNASGIVVAREIPDLDFITESENRVWGCSSANHEIYACKQGDPKNWHSFLNISTDSYAMTVGSAGDFTGACTHLGYVLFFKDNVIHRIYGNKPSNYQLSNVNARGVEAGSEKSIAIVNETLYYKARGGFCSFTSAMPTGISEPLGNIAYTNVVSGALGAKYYTCVKQGTTYTLFVYDTNRNMWHKEDNTRAAYFAGLGNELYYINATDNYLYAINGSTDYAPQSGAVTEADIDWYAETGDIGMERPDNKYISKLQIRLEVSSGATARISLSYDGGPWEDKYIFNALGKRTFTVPIVPKRCDLMRIRLSGTGMCKVYSITKTVEEGSEL